MEIIKIKAMDYKQHKGNLRGQIKNKVERKLYNKRIRVEAINDDTSDSNYNKNHFFGYLKLQELGYELPDKPQW